MSLIGFLPEHGNYKIAAARNAVYFTSDSVLDLFDGYGDSSFQDLMEILDVNESLSRCPMIFGFLVSDQGKDYFLSRNLICAAVEYNEGNEINDKLVIEFACLVKADDEKACSIFNDAVEYKPLRMHYYEDFL